MRDQRPRHHAFRPRGDSRRVGAIEYREELGLLRPDPEILKSLLIRGLPMGLQMFVISGAAMVMIGFVNS
ncbi:MAG: hypothetical protein V4503_12825, partial [Gemmatimonadota bacterium]